MLTLVVNCCKVQLGIEKHIIREVLEMKKLITILAIMIVLVGAVFAEETVNEGKQRITLETDVKESVPQFVFQGSLTGYDADDLETALSVADTSAEGSNNGKLLTSDALKTNKSIADANILVYFIIKQNAAKFVDGTTPAPTYARTQKTIEFSYVIGDLVQQAPENAPSTWTAKRIPGHLVASSATKAAAGNFTVGSTQYDNQIENAVSEQTFTAVYNGRVENGQEIGRFQAQWDQDPTVPNGVYKADITLTIAVQ